jgi:hypothetical protein
MPSRTSDFWARQNMAFTTMIQWMASTQTLSTIIMVLMGQNESDSMAKQVQATLPMNIPNPILWTAAARTAKKTMKVTTMLTQSGLSYSIRLQETRHITSVTSQSKLLAIAALSQQQQLRQSSKTF